MGQNRWHLTTEARNKLHEAYQFAVMVLAVPAVLHIVSIWALFFTQEPSKLSTVVNGKKREISNTVSESVWPNLGVGGTNCAAVFLQTECRKLHTGSRRAATRITAALLSWITIISQNGEEWKNNTRLKFHTPRSSICTLIWYNYLKTYGNAKDNGLHHSEGYSVVQ